MYTKYFAICWDWSYWKFHRYSGPSLAVNIGPLYLRFGKVI